MNRPDPWAGWYWRTMWKLTIRTSLMACLISSRVSASKTSETHLLWFGPLLVSPLCLLIVMLSLASMHTFLCLNVFCCYVRCFVVPVNNFLICLNYMLKYKTYSSLYWEHNQHLQTKQGNKWQWIFTQHLIIGCDGCILFTLIKPMKGIWDSSSFIFLSLGIWLCF